MTCYSKQAPNLSSKEVTHAILSGPQAGAFRASGKIVWN